MKALSIRQPWCWMILNAGKNIENRDWKPWNPGLKFRGDFLIHASAGMTKNEYLSCADTALAIKRNGYPSFPDDLLLPPFNDLDRGGIVGIAQIYNVVQQSESPWFFGRYGLVLRNARPLPFRPLKGQLGFFEVNDV
nr:ASCH domain-containing protein [uncultured Dongia sp.]